MWLNSYARERLHNMFRLACSSFLSAQAQRSNYCVHVNYTEFPWGLIQDRHEKNCMGGSGGWIMTP